MSESIGKELRALFRDMAEGCKEIGKEVQESVSDIVIAFQYDITYGGLKKEITYLKKKIESFGLNIIGIFLIIQNEGNLKKVDIEIICEKDKKRFKKKQRFEVRDIIDLPKDISDRLEKEKYVALKVDETTLI